VEHRWSISAVAAGCDPEPEPGDGSALDVVFWCPGTYEATLVPVDDLGAEGAPVTRTFPVALATGVPTLAVGPAISAQHRCDPEVPVCAVLAPDGTPSLRLAASGADPGGAPLAFEWTAIPPAPAAADPALALAFAPGPFDAAPTATIGNGGGPIAGVYRFRVRVRGSEGLLAQAFQEVVVDNRPPVASPAGLVLGHRYVDGVYLAEGDVDTGASDPDGDLLFAAGALDPAAPAGCTEEVTPATGGRVHVRIACSVPSALIGASARTLTAAIADPSGAWVAFTAPIAVANQPPSISLLPSFSDGLALDHRVEPCAIASGTSCFVAEAADPFAVVDPDGDPLSAYNLGATVASDRTSSRGTATVEGAAYRFRFETPTSLPGEFRSLAGASGFTVNAAVVDSFGATASVALPLAILNRAPTVLEEIPAASIPHWYEPASRRYRASATGPAFEDPDGDPLVPSVPPSGFCSTVTLDQGRATIGCERAWD
jgi:hypothetical protein